MPAEPTQAKLKRRSSRRDLEEYRFDGSHARELEQKRNRGEVSCAECRRLKIKCDKQIPCQSCQRRGCAALCPNGSLSTGQGTRFVLAATEHLHRRIATLSGRIRQLEDALASLQAKHSSETHPLLHEDLVMGEDDDGLAGVAEGPQAGGTGHAPDVIDAFGTLSISDHGISRFFGPTGGSESLLMANINAAVNNQSTTTPPTTSPHTPSTSSLPRSSISPPSATTSVTSMGDLDLFSQSFPFTPMGAPTDVQSLIESHLPQYESALMLVNTYLEQVSWIFHGVTKAQLLDDMLPAIYHRPATARGAGVSPGDDYSGPHDLALLFLVFAIGALVRPDPDSVPTPGLEASNNALGEHFHQVSRAALALQPVLEKPSIVTIQALHLMSIYNAMSGSDLRSETSMEMTWSLITLAAHLSQTIGLHRDSARWGLSPKMVQRRRILFWDLFVADVWQSLNTGRPPSFSLAYIDCSFPEAKDETGEAAEAGFGSAFSIWQCRFAAECVADVTARTLTAEAPTYATIMELDKKVREFPLPEGFGGSTKSGDKEEDLAGSFQRCVLDHIRETVLMYIHRSFFAQAIIEQPINPLKSAYAPSFLAAYRAASTILKSVREQFDMWPNSSARFWTMWTFAFTAAVVFGTVVTRGPRSPLAHSAMNELEQACILFSQASVYSIRATKALPILSKLNEKARQALAQVQKEPPTLSDAGGVLWNFKVKQEETEDDELSIFAGHTRFVSAKKAPTPDKSRIQYPSSQTSQASQPQPQQDHFSSHPPTSTTQMLNGWPSSSGEHQSRYLQAPLGTRGPDPLPPLSIQYSYVPSERVYQNEVYGVPSSYDDQSAPRVQHHTQQSYPQPLHGPTTTSNAMPAQFRTHHNPPTQEHYSTYAQSQQSGYRPPEHQQEQFQAQAQEYQGYPPHPSHSHQYITVQPPEQHAFHAHNHLPNPELADLGLAARDSRLDERWSSFMQDSGLLEGIGFSGHHVPGRP